MTVLTVKEDDCATSVKGSRLDGLKDEESKVQNLEQPSQDTPLTDTKEEVKEVSMGVP